MPHPSTRTEGRGKLNLGALPIELRPGPALLRYYALLSLFAGPLFPIPLTALWLRYRTLRYRIEEDGISMRWGALFRREVSLNYARIQDIHLSSNVVERWLGLGKIQVQTASASSKAEMTVEGVPDLQVMRDFLYGRMRGAKSGAPPAAPAGGGAADGALTVQLEALRGSSYEPLRQRIEKMLDEERFHAAHGAAWLKRTGKT